MATIDLHYQTLGELDLIEAGLRATGYPQVNWRVRGRCRIMVDAAEEVAVRNALKMKGLAA